MTGADVVIVGGGVIGLSAAYALAREGVRATVLDRGALGRAASWAGAGIISPGSGRPSGHPVAALRTRSARLYPEWSEALRQATGQDNGYRRCGGVIVTRTPAEDRELQAQASQWEAEAVAFERLDPADIRRIEPALNSELTSAYFLPGMAQVRNPRHLRALITAAESLGVELRPGVAAEGFATASGRIQAVRTSEGLLTCGQVVIAAGPWSAALLRDLGHQVETPPVQGQIVLLRGPRRLGRVIEHGKRYLVPRDDGRVLIGATEERVGFEPRPTAVAARDLLDEALTLCPSLADYAVERTWAGLRPGSRDTLPYLGPLPDLTNGIVATGHFRMGLQLSPATAEVIADLILGRPPRLDLAPLRPDRPPGGATPGVDPFHS